MRNSLIVFTASFALAQGPRIGIIDFYGLHKVPESKVRQALGVREGDPLPRSKGDTEERIDGLSGVVESHLEAVCCEAGQMILYVGVEEKGAPHFELRDAPEGEVNLPQDITATYRRFLAASEAATRLGQTNEDLTHGHVLSANPETREIQEQFVPIVKQNLGELRHVLRDSGDEEQRAIAAYVIAYSENKAVIVDDLQFALKDADAGVRINAARGLKALAVLARLKPDSGVKIEATWFIEMLNSLSWGDRQQALGVLQILTDVRNPSVIEQLRERALGSLVEMARWKSLTHALPAYLLLGRVAGLPDQQVEDAWNRGNRESVIAQAVSPKKKR
ncbi:MAG TPA: HEAT repeat domain-containing protein [Bryobacteraceae bacterium]|nr:HEAT repeat domain-containing protein [Bryobacteraceae bacterium]